MIVDKLNNHHLYKGISSRITLVFDFLNSQDIQKLNEPYYELEGKNVFLMVQKYETQKCEDPSLFLEGHKDYIDLHFMVKGSETIGYAPLDKQEFRKAYDSDKDYHLFYGSFSKLKLDTGMFCICFPEDLHLPRLKAETIQKVTKIVAKIKL